MNCCYWLLGCYIFKAMVKENIKTLLAYWDVVFFRIVPQAFCFGSPERSLYRMVIEDQRGEFFILEQIAQSNVLRKERIAIYLHQLKKQNPHFKIVPYKKNIHGKDVSFVEGKHWMLTPYLKTQPLLAQITFQIPGEVMLWLTFSLN